MGQRESTRVGSVAATLVLFYGALQRETGRKTSRGTEIGYQFHDIKSTCIGKRQKSPAKWRWLLWQGSHVGKPCSTAFFSKAHLRVGGVGISTSISRKRK